MKMADIFGLFSTSYTFLYLAAEKVGALAGHAGRQIPGHQLTQAHTRRCCRCGGVLLSVVPPAVAGVVVVARDAFRTACARRLANWMRLSGEIVGGDVVVGARVVVIANYI
jgi:hypothetical protein